MEYFLPDALGSVRQMTDEVGGVTLSQSFTPYGELLARGGIDSTAYDFAGEWTDPSGLQYLRARYYAPQTGRFISRDVWEGDVEAPMSYNAWLYGYANPVVYTDPSGMIPEPINTSGYSFYAVFKTVSERQWTPQEKAVVNIASAKIAKAYSQAYNREIRKQVLEGCGPTDL